MFRIVIFPTNDERKAELATLRQPDLGVPDGLVIESHLGPAKLQAYGMLYATEHPTDIVMLYEYDTGVCKHCHLPIEEVMGWVVHKWKHSGYNSYHCPGTAILTRAEPLEDFDEEVDKLFDS